MSAPAKEFLRVLRVDHHAERIPSHSPRSHLTEFHPWLESRTRRPRPRHFHRLRVLYRRDTSCSRHEHRSPSFLLRLVVRLQRPRHCCRPARHENCNLPFQILSRQVVILQLRHGQPIAHKNRIGFCFLRSVMIHRQKPVFPQFHRFRFAVAQKFQRRFALIDLARDEFHLLCVSFQSRWPKPRLLELPRHIRRRYLKPRAPRVAPFQFVVRQKLHVRPPALPERLPIRSRGHRRDSAQHSDTQCHLDGKLHRTLLTRVFVERLVKLRISASAIFFDAPQGGTHPRSPSAPRRAPSLPRPHSLFRAASKLPSPPRESRSPPQAAHLLPCGTHPQSRFSPARPRAAHSSFPRKLPFHSDSPE